jgi:hypothetical protein
MPYITHEDLVSSRLYLLILGRIPFAERTIGMDIKATAHRDFMKLTSGRMSTQDLAAYLRELHNALLDECIAKCREVGSKYKQAGQFAANDCIDAIEGMRKK